MGTDFVWQWRGDQEGEWLPYPAITCLALQAAKDGHGEPTVETTVGRTRYELDTARMVQINTRTRFQRKMECRLSGTRGRAGQERRVFFPPFIFTEEDFSEAGQIPIEFPQGSGWCMTYIYIKKMLFLHCMYLIVCIMKYCMSLCITLGLWKLLLAVALKKNIGKYKKIQKANTKRI